MKNSRNLSLACVALAVLLNSCTGSIFGSGKSGGSGETNTADEIVAATAIQDPNEVDFDDVDGPGRDIDKKDKKLAPKGREKRDVVVVNTLGIFDFLFPNTITKLLVEQSLDTKEKQLDLVPRLDLKIQFERPKKGYDPYQIRKVVLTLSSKIEKFNPVKLHFLATVTKDRKVGTKRYIDVSGYLKDYDPVFVKNKRPDTLLSFKLIYSNGEFSEGTMNKYQLDGNSKITVEYH